MNIETHSWAAIRSSFEPPRSSYLESIVLTSFASPNNAITSPLSARSEKRCPIFMRPNYARGYDKGGHTPLSIGGRQGYPPGKYTGKKILALSQVCQRLSYPV